MSARTGAYALVLGGSANAAKVRSRTWQVTEGRRYKFLCELQADSATAGRTVTIDAEWCDATGTTTATQVLFSSTVAALDLWQCVRAVLAPPAGARYVRFAVAKAAFAYNVTVDRLRCEEVSTNLDDAMSAITIVDDFVKDGTASPWGDLGWSEFAMTNVTIAKKGATAAGVFGAYSECGVIEVQSPTTNGQGGGLYLGSYSRPTFYGLPPLGFEWRAKVRVPTTFTGFRSWLGMWADSTTSPDAALGNAISGIGFRAETTGGVDNWYGIVRNGTSETAIDLGIAAGSTWTMLGWRYTGTGVQFQVGDFDAGSEVATNLPAASTPLLPLLGVLTTGGSATHELQVDTVGLRAYLNRYAAQETDIMAWTSVGATFVDAPADTVIVRVKAPPGTSAKRIKIRSSGIPTAGTIQVERDNDNTCVSMLSGGTAVNGTAVTPANDELSAALHATTANLAFTDTSWIKITVTNLALPSPTTDALDVAILCGVA